MTFPLIVLAFLATVVGFIGLPHLSDTHLPGWTHALATWLAPSVTPTGLQPRRRAPGDPRPRPRLDDVRADGRRAARRCRRHHRRVAALRPRSVGDGQPPRGRPARAAPTTRRRRSCGSTRSTTRSIVRPFRVVARGLYEIVDRFIIDTIAVNGSAFVVGLFGRVSRWFQNGQVQRYLAGLVVGAAAVFMITDCHQKPTFTLRARRRPPPPARRAGRRHRRRDGEGAAGTSTAMASPIAIRTRARSTTRPICPCATATPGRNVNSVHRRPDHAQDRCTVTRKLEISEPSAATEEK